MHRRAALLVAYLFGITLIHVALVPPAYAQTGRVSGVVRSEAGQPIKGATVVAENPDAAPSSFTASTDSRGRFAILGLRAGMWTLTAQAPGFAPSQASTRVQTLTPGQPINFVLPRGTGPALSALAGVSAKDLQEELGTADGLFGAGQYEQAITAYQEVLKRAPALTSVNLQIGNAYRHAKDYTRAVVAYQALLKADPTNEMALLAIAAAQVEQGQLDAAESTLTTAAESGANSRIFCELGEVKLLRKQPEEAVRWFERAREADPSWGRPLLKLGTMALDSGDRNKATRYFEQLLQTDPKSADAAEARPLMERLRQGQE